MTYRYRDLKTVARNDPRLGRSTVLANRVNGSVLIECPGVWTKFALHTAYLRKMCGEAVATVPPPLASAFKCAVCSADLGWDRPSGVCSEACLRKLQGFCS